MYLDFLRALVAQLEALNHTAATPAASAFLPYIESAPVVLEGELEGFFIDEIGGEYCYVEATDEDKTWWSYRPWAWAPRTTVSSHPANPR